MHLDKSANQKKPETEFVPHFCCFLVTCALDWHGGNGEHIQMCGAFLAFSVEKRFKRLLGCYETTSTGLQ